MIGVFGLFAFIHRLQVAIIFLRRPLLVLHPFKRHAFQENRVRIAGQHALVGVEFVIRRVILFQIEVRHARQMDGLRFLRIDFFRLFRVIFGFARVIQG